MAGIVPWQACREVGVFIPVDLQKFRKDKKQDLTYSQTGCKLGGGM